MKYQDLTTINTLSDSISICEHNDIQIVRIDHPLCQGAISLHGGHLISFKPTNEEDLIWVSSEALYAKDKAIRGGVPVCWPWFGKAGVPSHGFARTSEWQLVNHKENAKGVVIELEFNDSEDTLELWPHSFQNRLTFEFGKKLTISLKTTNISTKAFSYGGALHTYLNINDITKTELSGMGTEYLDNTQDGLECIGKSTLIIDKEVDRIYTSASDIITVKDTANERSLLVKNQGYNSAVIWNPWQDLSINMADMADDSFETMVCVESALNGLAITLMPNESHTLSTTLEIAAK